MSRVDLFICNKCGNEEKGHGMGSLGNSIPHRWSELRGPMTIGGGDNTSHYCPNKQCQEAYRNAMPEVEGIDFGGITFPDLKIPKLFKGKKNVN